MVLLVMMLVTLILLLVVTTASPSAAFGADVNAAGASDDDGDVNPIAHHVTICCF